jgi:hypothetical protein
MAEIVADHGHVGARLQQCDSAAVAEYVWRNPLPGKCRAILRCRCGRVLVQDVGDSVARQWLAMAIDEDMLLIEPLRHAAQPMQCICHLAPQR